jgi:hypothetical protein
MTQPPNVVIHNVGDVRPEHAPTGDPHQSASKPPQTNVIVDSRGRKIEVRPLSPVETYRLMKITRATGEEGFFGMAAMACAVRSIDGEPEGFINNERDIELMLQQLGGEGLTAVGTLLRKLNEAEDINPSKS